jgi:hypothetical protein
MADAFDWVFDFALQFLESDRFDAAVMDFVDEKCDVFDSEDENKFVYSDIHAEFREHIEALITSNLGEVGVTVAMFYESCEKGAQSRDINRAVFERMLAMEDFSTFKRIMVKRNMELQMLALHGGDGGDSDMDMTPTKGPGLMHTISTPMSPEEEKDQLERALSASMNSSLKMGELEKKLDKVENEDMEEILKNSLMEMELMHRREEMEQRELERAVAESLALEEERLETLQMEAQSRTEDKQSSAGGPHDEKDEKGSAASFEEDLAEEDYDAAAQEEEEPSPVAAGKGGWGSSSGDKQSSKADDSQSGDDGAKGDDATGAGECSSGNNKPPSKPPKKKKVPGADSKSSIPPPKPLKPIKGLGLGMGMGAALPPIRSGAGSDTPDDRAILQKMESDIANKKEEAEAVIMRGREQLAAQRLNEEKLRHELAAVAAKDGKSESQREEEMERRAAQMKAQRDRLVAMKKAERAQKVQEEEERNAKKNDDNRARMLETAPVDFLKQQKRAEDAEDKEAGFSGPSKEEVEESRRGAMRAALARRMKMNIAVGEEERLARLQAEQFNELEQKLGQVEQLRNDSRQVRA